MFSEALNLWFCWEDDQTINVRLLLPDDIHIMTSMGNNNLGRIEKLREQKHQREVADAIETETV